MAHAIRYAEIKLMLEQYGCMPIQEEFVIWWFSHVVVRNSLVVLLVGWDWGCRCCIKDMAVANPSTQSKQKLCASIL